MYVLEGLKTQIGVLRKAGGYPVYYVDEKMCVDKPSPLGWTMLIIVTVGNLVGLA